MNDVNKNEKRIAIYAGTFDPITFGHLDVLERASLLFDKVVIAVAASSSKKTIFTVDERIKMIKDSFGNIKNVEALSFKGLLVNFAKECNALAIVRGLRAISDFEYEFQMALTNRKIAESITTVFLMPNEKYSYLNSTLVREISMLGGDVSAFVPENVNKILIERFLNKS